MKDCSFDSLFSTGKLQIMKVLLPCLPADKRGGFAILIRFQELMLTLNYVQRHGNQIPLSPPPQGDALFDSILSYCSPSEEAQMQKWKDAFRQMEQMRDVMEMMNAMQELDPETFNPQNMDEKSLTEIIAGLKEASTSKGDKEEMAHGRMDGG